MNDIEKIINNLNGIKLYVYSLNISPEQKYTIMSGIQIQIGEISKLVK